jgi:hypothetical protein
VEAYSPSSAHTYSAVAAAVDSSHTCRSTGGVEIGVGRGMGPIVVAHPGSENEKARDVEGAEGRDLQEERIAIKCWRKVGG